MSIYERFSEQELEILRARAERAANTSQQGDAKETVTALQIKLGPEAYALPVTFLRAVYDNVTVVPVPCTPTFVAGIANVRGRIMPILELSVLLNVPGAGQTAAGSLVVVSREDFSLALRVEEVGEIATFSESKVSPLRDSDSLLDKARYLQGIVTDGPTLLNMDAILDDPALVVDDVI